MTIKVDDNNFEPDALMHCGPPLPCDATKSPTPWCLSKCCPRTVAHRDRATSYTWYFKLPSVHHYLIVWPDKQRIVHHSRMPNDQVATQVFTCGEIWLDPPGISVTVEEFYVD